MRAALVLVLPAAACFTRPDPIAGTPPADAAADGLVDGRLDASTSCAFDSFDMGFGACQPWGHGSGNATFTTTLNGELKITLMGDVNGACVGNAMLPFADGGIAMDIVEIPGTPTGYVQLVAFDGDTNPMILVEDGMILLTNEPRNDYVAKAYTPATMHWLRLRPDLVGGAEYIGETSPDGSSWTRLGRTTNLGPPADNVIVKLEAGVRMVGAPATQARIAEVRVCPP